MGKPLAGPLSSYVAFFMDIFKIKTPRYVSTLAGFLCLWRGNDGLYYYKYAGKSRVYTPIMDYLTI